MTLRKMLQRTQGNEVKILTDRAKDGFSAIDELITERNLLAANNTRMQEMLQQLTMENEHMKGVIAQLQSDRDRWFRSHTRIESQLQQLGSTLQTIWGEFQERPLQVDQAKVKQIAERFAPEKKDADVKSVA